MSKIKVAVWSGGNVHDFVGCGDEIRKTLESVKYFDVAYILDDFSFFGSEDLHSFDVLVFYCTNGELNYEQWANFSKWLASGKGFVPVHGGTASFKGFEEYRAMSGGYLVMHPRYRQYQVSILDREHPITKELDEFFVTDEQYITNHDPRVHVLATALYQGVAHPVAWTKGWGSGRVYFLALGHDVPACQNENFKLLLKRGVAWSAGVELDVDQIG